MKNKEFKKLRKTMSRVQDAKRYEHTLGVAYTAASLAMRYEENIEKALKAGILHDCAKSFSEEKLLAICEKHNVSINEVEKKQPSLLHAKVGSFLAMHKYHIRDVDIINAILNHTTGRPAMSKLEKIIFIADYIEPTRDQAPNLEQLRKQAFIDLDQTLLLILTDTLEHLKNSEISIDPMTQKTFDYYQRNTNIL